MVGIDEELRVAKTARAAIDTLSTAGPYPSILATLRNVRDVAARAMTFLGEGPLNDQRDKIGIAFSILIRALGDSGLTREKIENAKSANRRLDQAFRRANAAFKTKRTKAAKPNAKAAALKATSRRLRDR